MKDSRLFHRPDIQGLRALAVLLVVAFHAGLPLPGGFVGVDVFFVISGFVITGMLLREWQQSGSIDFKQFYLRRFKRLAPALALTVLVTLGLSAWILPNSGDTQINTAQTALGSVLMYANFAIAYSTGGYFDAPAESNPLLNTWSLSVEEQFYLVFPALLLVGLLLSRRTKIKGLLSALIAVVGIASFATMMLGDRDNELFGFYSPLPRAWEFVVGILLAIALQRFNGATLGAVGKKITVLSGIGGVMLLVIATFGISSNTEFPSLWTLLPVLGTAMLLLSGMNQSGFLTKALSARPVVKIGDWSYSIYLWHWPLIVFAGFIWPNNSLMIVLAAAFSVPLSAVTYRWVEKPLRQIRLKRTIIIALAGCCVAVPVQAASAYQVGAENEWNAPAIAEFSRAVSPHHLGHMSDCYINRNLDKWAWDEKCTFNAAAQGKPIYLLGDSNADHFSEGVVSAGIQIDRPVLVRAMARCPIAEMTIVYKGEVDKECLEFNNHILDWLATQNRGTVLLGFTDNYLMAKDFSIESIDGKQVSVPADGISVLTEALTLTAKHIASLGYEVILIDPIPSFSNPEAHEMMWRTMIGDCSLRTVTLNGGSCIPAVLSSDYVDRKQGAVWTAVQGAARSARVSTFDTREAICPKGKECSTIKDGTWMYRDAVHLSVEGSLLLKDRFVRALSR